MASHGIVLLAGCPLKSVSEMLHHRHMPLLLGQPHLEPDSNQPVMACNPVFGAALEPAAGASSADGPAEQQDADMWYVLLRTRIRCSGAAGMGCVTPRAFWL